MRVYCPRSITPGLAEVCAPTPYCFSHGLRWEPSLTAPRLPLPGQREATPAQNSFRLTSAPAQPPRWRPPRGPGHVGTRDSTPGDRDSKSRPQRKRLSAVGPAYVFTNPNQVSRRQAEPSLLPGPTPRSCAVCSGCAKAGKTSCGLGPRTPDPGPGARKPGGPQDVQGTCAL